MNNFGEYIYIYIYLGKHITYYQFVNVRKNKNFCGKTIKPIIFHLLNQYFDHYTRGDYSSRSSSGGLVEQKMLVT